MVQREEDAACSSVLEIDVVIRLRALVSTWAVARGQLLSDVTTVANNGREERNVAAY